MQSGWDVISVLAQNVNNKREPNVRYAVGMILRKKPGVLVDEFSDDDGIVVITGWMYDVRENEEIPNHSKTVLYNGLSDDYQFDEIKWMKQGMILLFYLAAAMCLISKIFVCISWLR